MIVGIDGGLTGGIVVLNNDGTVFTSCVMPTIKGKQKNEFDISTLSFMLYGLKKVSKEKNEKFNVFLEKAWPRPVSGKRACWMNGFGYGLILGILNSLDIDYEIVNPGTWMKELNINSKQGKGSIDWCIKKYPNDMWKRNDRCKIYHDGMTDSAGISWYGYLKINKLIKK